MYRAAGARLSFDIDTIGPLVELLESEIARVRAELPAGH
jgi:hypothetical protein